MSLWDTITGRAGKNASAEQLKKQEAKEAAEKAAAELAAKQEAEREAARKRVSEIRFKKGGMVRGDGVASKGKTKGRFI